jgi:hypothetical protein
MKILYEYLIPGTEAWMRVWKIHPELQKQMSEYAKTPKKVIVKIGGIKK